MREISLEDRQKSPAYRTLMVMAAIGEHGPITLAGLCERLPIARTAIWRAAATLRDFGWVRIRLSDKAYELTTRCDLILAKYHFGHPASDRAAAELTALRGKGIAVSDAGMFVAPGNFSLIESIRSDATLGVSLSLINDPFALSVQAAMPPEQLLRHLHAYLKTAEPDEKELIRSGAHARVVMALTNAQKAGRESVPKMIPFEGAVIFLSAPAPRSVFP